MKISAYSPLSRYVDIVDAKNKSVIEDRMILDWDTETNSGTERLVVDNGVFVENPVALDNVKLVLKIPKDLEGNCFIMALISEFINNEKGMGYIFDN